MTNIDRIFALFLKKNNLTLKAFSKEIAGLKENSLKGSSALQRYKEMTVKILASKTIDQDFFIQCPQCEYLNPNDRDLSHLSDEELEEDKHPCEGCGASLFP